MATIINGMDLLLYKKTINAISTHVRGAAGTGYAANDTFYISGGSSLAKGKVLTVSAGAVQTYEITYFGAGYTTGTKATTNIVGTGTGLTISVSTVSGTVYKATGHSLSHTLTINLASRDTSSKADGIYASREGGRLDVQASAEGLCVYNDTVGFKELQRLIHTREQVFLLFAQNGDVTPPIDDVTPDLAAFYAQGYFYVTSVEMSAPDQENTTYSVSFELANNFELINT